MNSELHFNKGLHVEVFAARQYLKPLYFVYGPCGTVVDCTANERKARELVFAQNHPNRFSIRKQTIAGMLIPVYAAPPIGGFQFVDLISRAIK